MKRAHRWITWGVALVVWGWVPGRSFGVLPLPTYPDCGKDRSVAECPPDLTHTDGTWKGSTWEFVSFIPEDMESHVRAQEWALGAGNGFDVAWRYTTGRFDVTVAVLDAGILWDERSLVNKVALNTGELPLPRRADGSTCATYDCNGDGLVNVQDYREDSRVSPEDGTDVADGYLDASDLIAAFSDGVDGDGNGYIDDICGWDFLWDDNNPYASNRFDHGSDVMRDMFAEGGEPDSSIGYCPNCSVLPLRTGDSFIADGDRLAQGILYATDAGVSVISMASGTTTNPAILRQAIKYAYDHGVLVVSAIGDELSYHHLYPGASDYLMAVHSIRYWPPTDWNEARSFLAYNGCNNFGSHLTVVGATVACATGATAITASTAGLIVSRARDLGLELHPDEIRGLILGTATDIDVPFSGHTTPYFPSRPGWDLFFGYGRINAGKAVESFAVPPRVHLTSPVWWEYVDAGLTTAIEIQATMGAPRARHYEWVLEWAPGGRPADNAFEELARGVRETPFEGTLFTWPIAQIPRDRLDPSSPMEQVFAEDDVPTKFDLANAHTVTLRLSATDEMGRRAEMRKSFFLHDDPDLLPGFPMFLGASGQSSPVLTDVDGDGVNEIVVGTSSGVVHVLDARTGVDLPGWPVQMPFRGVVDPLSWTSHAYAPAYASGAIPRSREAVVATVAVGDLEPDGGKDLVVSTMEGKLYVFDAEGELRDGFPVSRDVVTEDQTDEFTWYDPGFMSSPVLADLDGDGRQEIIQAGMDQKLYVWRADGSRHPGFPVKLEHEESATHRKGRIVSTPAVVDLNRDGVLDIVIGTNEFQTEPDPIPGYAYAVSGKGNLDPAGPILPGWPAVVPGLLNDLVPWLAEGVNMSPQVADIDGKGLPEIALCGTVSCPHFYEADASRSTQCECSSFAWRDPATRELAGLSFVSNLWIGDVDGDGHLEITGALAGLNYALVLLSSTWVDHIDHLLGLWDAETGQSLPGWPVVMEDLALYMQPTMADVDGDGLPEIIASSGGYLVHAFDIDGFDVPGWPRLTGGMVSSAIAAGDVTGDGLNEVVVMTHEGYLFAWATDGIADSGAARTGYAGPALPTDLAGSKRVHSTR